MLGVRDRGKGSEDIEKGSAIEIYVKKDKNKFIISISSNLPNENLQVRATKKGQKAISFKITTNDDGVVKFTTTRSLGGFQVGLLLDGEILSSVKAN